MSGSANRLVRFHVRSGLVSNVPLSVIGPATSATAFIDGDVTIQLPRCSLEGIGTTFRFIATGGGGEGNDLTIKVDDRTRSSSKMRGKFWARVVPPQGPPQNKVLTSSEAVEVFIGGLLAGSHMTFVMAPQLHWAFQGVIASSTNSVIFEASAVQQIEGPLPGALTILSSETQLTRAQSGRRFLVDGEETFAIVLPPCRSQDVGTVYEFIVRGAGGGTISILTNDVFIGNVVVSPEANAADIFASDGTSNNVLTLDSPAAGGRLRVEMVSNSQWTVAGKLVALVGNTGFGIG